MCSKGTFYFTGEKNVKEVVIPYGFTIIGENAFSLCKNSQMLQFQIVLLKLVNGLFGNAHRLQILQFQTVLLKYVLLLLKGVHHLQILQFQVVLLKLVILLLNIANHLQILQFQILLKLLEDMFYLEKQY